MGYWVEQTDGRFRMAAEKKPDALGALYAMWDPGHEHEMTGGRWEGHVRTIAWYAWTDHARWRNRGFVTFEEGIEDWRFTPTVNDDGDVIGLWLPTDGTKVGQAHLMFTRIAPYVDAGSYLAFLGEDGFEWEWHFDGSGVHEVVVQEPNRPSPDLRVSPS